MRRRPVHLARRRNTWPLAAVSIALATLACSAPKIDTSTDETLKKSIVRARESLPEDQRARFDEAVMILALKDVAGQGLLALAAQSPAQLQAQAAAKLDGKTAAEIVAEADAIIAPRKAAERTQALAEIKELDAKKAGALAARAQLARFEVTRSRFRMLPRESVGPKPVIELRGEERDRRCRVASLLPGHGCQSGRVVPWIEEDFNFEIASGLEPGEVGDWTIEPNQYKWRQTAVPKDAVMTVEVVRLDGADGKVLYDSSFDEADAKRLESLKASFK